MKHEIIVKIKFPKRVEIHKLYRKSIKEFAQKMEKIFITKDYSRIEKQLKDLEIEYNQSHISFEEQIKNSNVTDFFKKDKKIIDQFKKIEISNIDDSTVKEISDGYDELKTRYLNSKINVSIEELLKLYLENSEIKKLNSVQKNMNELENDIKNFTINGNEDLKTLVEVLNDVKNDKLQDKFLKVDLDKIAISKSLKKRSKVFIISGILLLIVSIIFFTIIFIV